MNIKRMEGLRESEDIFFHDLFPAAIRQAVGGTIAHSATNLLQIGANVLKYPCKRVPDVVISGDNRSGDQPARKPWTHWRFEQCGAPGIERQSASSRAIPDSFDIVLDFGESRRPRPSEFVHEMPGSVVRDVSQPRVVVDHRARSATDDGTVRVGTSSRVYTSNSVLTFPVKEGWENRLFHDGTNLVSEGQPQRVKISRSRWVPRH